jgi:hypothetical protein
MKPPARSRIFPPRSLASKTASKHWRQERIRADEIARQTREEQAEHEEALRDRKRIEKTNGKKMKSQPPARPKKDIRAKAQLNLTDPDSRIMPSHEWA